MLMVVLMDEIARLNMKHDPEIDPTIREAAEAAERERLEEERTERIVRRTLRAIRREEAGEAGEAGENDEEPDEAPQPAAPRRSALRRAWNNAISGNFLGRDGVRRSYAFMGLVAVLIVIYIANVFNTQKLYRYHDKLVKDIRALRTESLSTASERMRATRQSNIVAEIERRGIPVKESPVPVRVIEKK